MTKRVFMSDVAAAAGVSKTTVSLVLNDVPGTRIPKATRSRVFRAAQTLGYRHPAEIRRDSARRSPVVGVLINEISQAYPINLLDGLQSAADDLDVAALIQITDGRPERESNALTHLADLGALGIIYASSFSAEVTPTAELERFRHVYLNCRRKDSTGSSVVIADQAIGHAAIEHLLERGRRRIAIITGDPWQIGAQERLAGAKAALAAAGIAPFAIEAGMWEHGIAADAARRIMSGDARPDAFYCQNDVMARGVLAALGDLGVSVPVEVAVLGSDNREFARDLVPPLTTFDPPHAEMAEQAIRMLCAEAPLTNSSLPVMAELMLRGST